MALSQCIKGRHLAQKSFKFHPGVKKCHFGNFSKRTGMAVPCQCGPQESLGGSERFSLFQVPMNSQQCLEGKLESASIFQYFKEQLVIIINLHVFTFFFNLCDTYFVSMRICNNLKPRFQELTFLSGSIGIFDLFADPCHPKVSCFNRLSN